MIFIEKKSLYSLFIQENIKCLVANWPNTFPDTVLLAKSFEGFLYRFFLAGEVILMEKYKMYQMQFSAING